MSNVGTFGMFTTVRLGIYTSQQGLNLTGNNIANINTVGYTRQTLDIQSMNAAGVDRYMDSTTRIGSGAYVTGISQMRDPYLDIRYRTECASVGYMDTKLSNLNDLAAILDEVGDGDDENGIIAAQFNKILSALENLTEYTGQGEFDTQVRSSAASLVSLFNSYAGKLEQVEINAVDRFNQDVVAVNELLQNIRNLTTQIRTGDIHGTPGLEIRDERNRLIDELSQYIKIDVRYEMENIAPGVDVEKLRIKLADHHDPEIYLVDGIYATQLQHDEEMPVINPSYPDGGRMYVKKGTTTGETTNNIEEAEMTANTNYNLTLSALTDNKGNVQTRYLDVTKEDIVVDTLDATNPLDKKILDAIDLLKDPNTKGPLTIDPDLDEETGDLVSYSLHKQVEPADPADPNSTEKITYSVIKTFSKVSIPVSLGDNDLYGSLQAAREFLTEEGEFATSGYINVVDPSAATKRGVKYYRHALDLLARKFADSMNDANNGFLYSQDPNATGDDADKYFYLNADGSFLKINGQKVARMPTADLMQLLEQENIDVDTLATHRDSGNLFSIRGDSNDGTGITASNISISAAWASGEVQIVNSYVVIPRSGTPENPVGTIGTTDNTNILHMVTLMGKDLIYRPDEIVGNAKGDPMFTGSFGEMLGNINAVLGNDQSSTQIMLDNYYEAAVELDTNRDSISSVDLNDETVNMIQYQKSYSAACRLMTAMDEILDKLINGTGVAGR